MSTDKTVLDNVIYLLELNEKSGELYLRKIQDKFDFPFKVYGLERQFIDKCKIAYNNTTGNFGVLFKADTYSITLADNSVKQENEVILGNLSPTVYNRFIERVKRRESDVVINNDNCYYRTTSIGNQDVDNSIFEVVDRNKDGNPVIKIRLSKDKFTHSSVATYAF